MERSVGAQSGSPPDVVPGDSGEKQIPFGNDKRRKLHLRESGFREGLIKSWKMPSAAKAALQSSHLRHG